MSIKPTEESASAAEKADSQTPSQVPRPQYSAFNQRQKRCIVLLIATAAVLSPLSSFIYYPATNALAQDLDVTVEKINLGITTYMIISGITPAIIGGLADQIGRRPVYLVTLTIYIAANVGLALQKNYTVLLVLRAVQSAGSSGTIAIAYGVISDIATTGERGSYVGAFQIGPNVAPSLGPILGGILADLTGWRWIFWFLTIFSGVIFCLLLAFLPETARTVVGSGEVSAKHMNLWPSYLSRYWHQQPAIRSKRRFHIPNPLKSLYIVAEKDSAAIIFTNGIFYMTYCCVQTSLSSLFIDLYHLTELQSGLIYLPFGVGCAIGSYAFGKVMTRDYKVTAKAAGVIVDRSAGDDLSKLHIEAARLRSAWWVIGAALVCILVYGWTLHTKISMAVPLVFQFFIGFLITGIFNMCMTLLVDIHPKSPSTAQASLNIIRCVLAAGGIGVLQIVINAIGVGWCFTLIAGLCLLSVPLVYAEITWGPRWRMKRLDDSLG